MSQSSKLQLYHIGALERAIGDYQEQANRLAELHDYSCGFFEGDAQALREVRDMLVSAALVGSL